MNKRQFLTGLGLGCLSGMVRAFPFHFDKNAPLMNPCLDPLPAAMQNYALVKAAWQGLAPERVWDTHAHLLGNGDSGSGCWINPQMESLAHPQQFLQRKFFLNASCVSEKMSELDESYVARLVKLLAAFPSGASLLLFAFDHTYQENGERLDAQTAFHVPNRYAAQIAKRYPERFKCVASIHPYRKDAVEALAEVVVNGAVAIKWLPSSMGIDPASARCNKFYEALKQHNLPLITHAGEERAVKGAHQQDFGNPLRLRRALEHGVRVVVAHCASMGEDRDIDKGPHGPYRECFALFSRLMQESRYEGRLFGDISALPQTNRVGYLPRIVERTEWHSRLLNGSDYPLPGVMPLFSIDLLVKNKWLKATEAAVLKQIRAYNPLLFDFVLKRSVRIDGQRLSDAIFETRHFFERNPIQRKNHE